MLEITPTNYIVYSVTIMTLLIQTDTEYSGRYEDQIECVCENVGLNDNPLMKRKPLMSLDHGNSLIWNSVSLA